MVDRIKVIYVPVGGKPFEMTIDCTLEAFRGLVDGYFDYVMVDEKNAMVYNVDDQYGDVNFRYKGIAVCGAVFFASIPHGRSVTWQSTTLSLSDVGRLIERGETT